MSDTPRTKELIDRRKYYEDGFAYAVDVFVLAVTLERELEQTKKKLGVAKATLERVKSHVNIYSLTYNAIVTSLAQIKAIGESVE